MKRMHYLLATAAILAVVGCAKEAEKEIVNPESNMVTLRASVEDTDTRVSIGNDYAFAFQSGDKVSVLTDGGEPVEFETSDSGTSATFEGTFGEGKSIGSYALYPASVNHMADGDEVLFYMNEELTWKADESYMPMLGKVESGNITFKAVGGVMKLIVYNIPSNAAYLQFTATNKKISGGFEITDASVENPVIVTAAKDASDDTMFIDFSEDYSVNKVFYIPLPTGTIDGFTISFLDGNFDDIEGASKTTTANLNVTRNKIILAPALNLGATGNPPSDATLTNAEITNAKNAGDLGTSYGKYTFTNAAGQSWSVGDGGYMGNVGSSGDYYIQLKKGTGYLKLPEFDNSIATVTLHNVVNANETKYTGTVHLRSGNTGSSSSLSSGTQSSAGDDIVLTVPSNVKTGYIIPDSDSAIKIYAVTVSFVAGTPATKPIINIGSNSVTIAAAKLNASVNGVSLSNGLDGLGITVLYTADWIQSATIDPENNRLVISASSYNHGEEARTATITLKATGAESKSIVVTQNPSIVPSPSLDAPTSGNKTFAVTWTADGKAGSYEAYYSTNGTLDESGNPATGTEMKVTNEGSAYTAEPKDDDNAIENDIQYFIYVRVKTVAEESAGKYVASSKWSKASVTPRENSFVLSEDFSSLTTWGTSFTSKELPSGTWTGSGTYTQVGCVKIGTGTGSTSNKISLPALASLTTASKVKLTFKAVSSDANYQLSVTATNAGTVSGSATISKYSESINNNNQTAAALNAAFEAAQPFSFVINNATSNTVITIKTSSSSKRWYIDDVVVELVND